MKKAGLDTDILVALIEKEKEFSIFKPRIFKKENKAYICQKVFAQTLGVLIHKKDYNIRNATNKLFDFLRNYKISIIKNSELDINKLNDLLSELKEKRKNIKANPDDMDLEIIAVYKLAGIDCIFTINSYHFDELGKYLNMRIEKPMEDVDMMLRNIFSKKKRLKIN